MAKILVQVQEDSDPSKWGIVNTFEYDPHIDRPKYVHSKFCDTYDSCYKRAHDALCTWSMYHLFVGKTMRLFHEGFRINETGKREYVEEAVLVINRGETNAH